MPPRQARRERREAERKAKKAEWKRLKAAGCLPIPDSAAFVEDPSIASISPELTEEFSPEFIARARSIRERMERKLAVEAGTQSGFVSQPASPLAERNRKNSLHSSGPRSPQGRLASSRNSLKHGLAVGQVIIPGEDPAAFEALLQDLLEEHQPANATEELLVREMAQSYWLTQRAIRLQNECFTENGIDEKRLALFLRYGTTYDRAFHRALNTLIRLKQSRSREQRAPASGFVSQHALVPRPMPGFVSQTGHESPSSEHVLGLQTKNSVSYS